MPTFVQEAETAWNTTTSPKTTPAFDVVAGDLIVTCAASENWSSGAMVTTDSSGLAWTVQQSVASSNMVNVTIATAVAPFDISGLVVTFTRTGVARLCGGTALTFQEAAPGASSQTTNFSGAPSLSLTPTAVNSAIVMFNGDANATDGASRVYRLGAGAFTEQTYFTDGTLWTVYCGFYADAGAIGAKTVGLSAPGIEAYAIAALEIVQVDPPPLPEQTDIITILHAR